MSQSKFYILDGEKPVAATMLQYAEWCAQNEPYPGRVAWHEIGGNSTVSTVFLALDHNFGSDGPPILWETMVFGGPLDQRQDRCSGTLEQAEAMHERMCERVRAALQAQV